MTKLIISTGNIVSGGPSIIRKPGAYRSNLELTNSLRSNFLAAQQDYSAAASPESEAEATTPAETNGFTNGHTSNGNIPNGLNGHTNGHLTNGNGNGHSTSNGNGSNSPRFDANGRPRLDIWTALEDHTDTLYVPRIDWDLAGLQEEPSAYDVTVKLFFLPSASVADRARHASEALALVRRELDIERVDLLIASFPDMSFEGDCEWEADKRNAQQGDVEAEAATWAVLEDLQRQGLVSNLGIAEFGTEKLAAFLKKVNVRPAVDQINIHNCCNVPPPLIQLAKAEGIELLVHTDCTDVLPKGTLRELLGHGLQGAGVLADPVEGHDGLRGELEPQWVVKYTAFVKNRGVIENKGYFAGAELVAAA
ncbi:glutamate-cysteine ligase modifier subunit [Verticillium alfalfae VaMs.102]|uniref:GCS light chain n=1 Tax=Verticillium alfalfae (strain VaMs.102 / ATCC MYA-4576 / FGSC 10136) TaxID=526221 RepID=C9S556_VERA1|nr:glutamate-cysteine ligase modifier subunit [Verticillium alfalfae VaMs.102]EEY14156.1 glutamate-cysteine ligase modifier subunit [Verticillium alfalfae VaMs.102]